MKKSSKIVLWSITAVIIVVAVTAVAYKYKERLLQAVTITTNNSTHSIQLQDKEYLWQVNFDEEGRQYLVKGKKLEGIKDSLSLLIQVWNAQKNTKIELKKAEDSTIYIKIPQAEVLTNQSGSFGATELLSVLTYTFTENSRYKYIDLDFEEGDHATPGRYSRKDFEKEFVIKE